MAINKIKFGSTQHDINAYDSNYWENNDICEQQISFTIAKTLLTGLNNNPNFSSPWGVEKRTISEHPAVIITYNGSRVDSLSWLDYISPMTNSFKYYGYNKVAPKNCFILVTEDLWVGSTKIHEAGDLFKLQTDYQNGIAFFKIQNKLVTTSELNKYIAKKNKHQQNASTGYYKHTFRGKQSGIKTIEIIAMSASSHPPTDMLLLWGLSLGGTYDGKGIEIMTTHGNKLVILYRSGSGQWGETEAEIAGYTSTYFYNSEVTPFPAATNV